MLSVVLPAVLVLSKKTLLHFGVMIFKMCVRISVIVSLRRLLYTEINNVYDPPREVNQVSNML